MPIILAENSNFVWNWAKIRNFDKKNRHMWFYFFKIFSIKISIKYFQLFTINIKQLQTINQNKLKFKLKAKKEARKSLNEKQ